MKFALYRSRAATSEVVARIAGDFVERAALQIFNPGSPTDRRRQPAHTMGLAHLTDGRVTFELVTPA